MGMPFVPLPNARRPSFFISVLKSATLTTSATSSSSPGINESRQVPNPFEEAKYAAFLGEADSDDGFEVGKLERGDTQELVDPVIALNAAFLGEADSDDGFEAQRAEEGDRHEAMDATNAAFLGEADSDDGFEADFEVHPSKYAHRIEDT